MVLDDRCHDHLTDSVAHEGASREAGMTVVSVIVPTADRPDLLARAVASVAAAAEACEPTVSCELIVVDDEHSEATKDFVEGLQLGLQARYLRHPRGPRRGPASCRNLGVRRSKGQFIAWLDDDDAFLPHRFARCLGPLASGAAEVVLETALRERRRSDGTIEEFLTGPGGVGADPNPFCFLLTEPEEGHIATGATTFSRAAFDRVGGLDEKLTYGEDGEFLLRLALTTRTVLLEGPPVVRIYQHESNTSRPSRLRYWGPLKAMRALDRNADWTGKVEERAFLRGAMSAKVDFALTRCRLEYDYSRRIREGLAVLRYLPLGAFSWRNIKSIGVWLSRPRTPS